MSHTPSNARLGATALAAAALMALAACAAVGPDYPGAPPVAAPAFADH